MNHLAPLFLALAACLGIAACALTPEAQGRVDVLEAERAALTTQLETADAGTAAAVAEALAAKTAEIAAVEADDVAAQVGGVAAPFLPFVPAPYQGAAYGVLALLPWLARKRSRQHMADAFINLTPVGGDVAPVQAALSVARAFGWAHSSEDQDELLAVALKKSQESGVPLSMPDLDGDPQA